MKCKCETCGRVIESREWPDGWVRSGTSSYGKEFDRMGIAWHCPVCYAVRELAVKYIWSWKNQDRIRSAIFQVIGQEVARARRGEGEGEKGLD
jgi:hypothetical protein